MARPFHQILAGLHIGWGICRQGHDWRGIKIQKLPQADPAPDVEREGDIAGGGLAGNGRQAGEIGKQIGDVAGRHPGIAGVGKGRIIMAAIRADAAAHGVVELGQAPVADAVGAGRDVGRLEAAERRHQRRAASQRQARIALGALCGMAGRAAASMK